MPAVINREQLELAKLPSTPLASLPLLYSTTRRPNGLDYNFLRNFGLNISTDGIGFKRGER